MATTMVDKDEQFFYEQAGYSFDLKNETQDEGRRRCARELAADELWARNEGVQFVWEYDDMPYEPGDVKNDDGTPYTPNEVLCCAAMYEETCYASLGGIDDPTPEYRRVIEAELAGEARGRIEKAKAHAAMIAPVLDDLKAARDKLNATIGGTLPEGLSTRPRLPYVLALKEAADAIKRAQWHIADVVRIP